VRHSLSFLREYYLVSRVFRDLAPVEFQGVEHGFVGELAVGDEKQFSAALERGDGGLQEGAAEVYTGRLAGVEWWIHDDGVVGVRQAGGDVVPVEVDLRCIFRMAGGRAGMDHLRQLPFCLRVQHPGRSGFDQNDGESLVV